MLRYPAFSTLLCILGYIDDASVAVKDRTLIASLADKQ